MLDIIEKLYPLNRVLVGDEEDLALKYISNVVPLRLIKVRSGITCFTWKIPEKWIVKSASLFDLTSKKEILNYKNSPFHLFVGSLPFEGIVNFSELDKHLKYKTYFGKDKNAVPYSFPYYDLNWGFCLSENQYKKINKKHKFKVSIKTKYSKGYLQIGEAVIKGKTSEEIIVIAHVDHPYQANDNLSAVSAAIEIVKEVKKLKLKHTVKVLFLPETIGSIAYVWKRKSTLSKIKMVIALDVVGNKNRVLIQKTFDGKHYLNYLSESCVKWLKLKHEMADFRQYIGSDELIFSDPEFKIPSIMISTWPYKEYHTNLDTPKVIDKQTLGNIKKLTLNIITNFDKNFVPKRLWNGPLMRSKIGWFLGHQPEDSQLELFGYKIDGIKSVVEIAEELKMDVTLALDYTNSLKQKGLVK